MSEEITIVHWNHPQEAKLCADFLAWQRQNSTTQESKDCLSFSSGTGRPVTKINSIRVATGFKELYQHWDKNGLWLL